MALVTPNGTAGVVRCRVEVPDKNPVRGFPRDDRGAAAAERPRAPADGPRDGHARSCATGERSPVRMTRTHVAA
ncbi:hypothetical protein GCM10019016_040500 [Streptomyces prasinosporus]|uniref:Uncharacterized protein n=1 Tax=Streptomyces prasinosporus TaxID=68256 RepID=A0ABP6TNU4_9ACTN